ANSNELYVSLIEKAVAKCFGCYEKIIKGHCIDGLSILTGAPCESIFLKQCKDIDEPWESIRQWRDKQFPMSCSCGNKRVSYNSFNNIGLHPYHAYSILDTEEIKNKRVFKLRNPWGTTNWKGKFSQRSSIWTKSLLENHDPEIEASKGIFRIPLEDFCRFFNSIDVAFTDPDLFEVRYRYTSEYAMFTLVVPNSAKSCDCNFSLYQKQQHDRCKHVDLLIYVGKADTLKQVTRSRRVVRESFTGCSQTLPAGEYIVICMSIIGASEYCTFVVHSRCRLLIRKQDKPITEQTIDRALVQMAIGSNSEVLKVPNCNGSVHQLATNMSGLLIVAVNNHKSLEMKVKCDCSKSENMISSRNSKFKINDIIPAKSIAVLIILTHKDTNKDYVLIQRDGVASLTSQELQKACRDRGMCYMGISVDRLKSQLRQWIDFHLNHRIPVTLLLLSRSFYLPDMMSPEKMLTDTIAQLPLAVEKTTTRKLAESQGLRVDNKEKLEEVRQVEEAIAKENKEIEDEKIVLAPDAQVVTDNDMKKTDKKETPDLLRLPIADTELVASRLASALMYIASKKNIDLSELEYDELKEDVRDYQTDNVQLQPSRSENLLTKRITKLLENVNSLSSKLHKKQKMLRASIENKEEELSKGIESADGSISDIDLLSSKREDLVHLNEMLGSLEHFHVSANNLDESVILDVIKQLDLDGDNQIAIADLLQV
ncbi:hypothetical protein GJ496_000048, partial [Pomphorhynchus laevis]